MPWKYSLRRQLADMECELAHMKIDYDFCVELYDAPDKHLLLKKRQAEIDLLTFRCKELSARAE